MDVNGRVAAVTGAGMGIGAAIARRLARLGARVLTADIDPDAARGTAAAIEGAGGRAEPRQVDVSDEADVRAMVDAAVAAFGGLDILVNNAGIATTPAFPDTDVGSWTRVLDVNLRGVMLGTHYGIEAMRRGSGGTIINVASLAGIGTGAHASPDYAATKAGVVRLTTALAPLASSHAIRVNVICPDWVDTPMSQRTRARMTPDQRAAEVPAGILSPDDIADAAVELIEDESLAGRVMCCWCGRPRSLLPRDEWA